MTQVDAKSPKHDSAAVAKGIGGIPAVAERLAETALEVSAATDAMSLASVVAC